MTPRRRQARRPWDGHRAGGVGNRRRPHSESGQDHRRQHNNLQTDGYHLRVGRDQRHVVWRQSESTFHLWRRRPGREGREPPNRAQRRGDRPSSISQNPMAGRKSRSEVRGVAQRHSVRHEVVRGEEGIGVRRARSLFKNTECARPSGSVLSLVVLFASLAPASAQPRRAITLMHSSRAPSHQRSPDIPRRHARGLHGRDARLAGQPRRARNVWVVSPSTAARRGSSRSRDATAVHAGRPTGPHARVSVEPRRRSADLRAAPDRRAHPSTNTSPHRRRRPGRVGARRQEPGFHVFSLAGVQGRCVQQEEERGGSRKTR